MSRSSAPVLTTLPLLLLLLLGAAVLSDDAHTTDTSCSVQSCAALDAAVLSSYVSSLNVSEPHWPVNDTTSNESAQQLPPFGALASDWSRLLLLQNRQPEGSPLRDNLLRLSRILLAAYFDAEDDGGAEWSARPTDDGQVEAEQASGNNATAAGQKRKDISADNEEATTTEAANNNGEPKNLNRTLPAMDNEANERSGDESTTLTNDNEDESGRTETSGALGTTADDRFALTVTTVASEGKSSESSGANEAVHPRSKEDFLEAKYAEKEGDGDGRVARFFMSDESDSSITSDELVNNFFAMEDNVANANQSSVEETTDRMTKGLEDFFNGEDNNNNNTSASVDSASVEFNSTKSIEDFFAQAEEVSKIATTTDVEIDFNSQDSEEIISPSVEDFLAREEDFINATTLEGNSTSGEVEVPKSIEGFFKSKEPVDDHNKVTANKSLLVNTMTSDGNVTKNGAMVSENLDVFSASKEEEENKTVIEKKDGVIDKFASGESKKVSEDEKSNDTIRSTTNFEEATTTATIAVENATTSETIPVSTITESYSQNNVTSTSTETPTILLLNSLRIDDNPTTLVQLISGQLTTLLPVSNSNEITSQVNGVVELSEDKNKLEITTSTSPPGKNRTTVKTDDLPTTTERQTEADVSVTQALSEVPVEEAAAVTTPLVRQARHIPMSSHLDDSSPVIAAAIAPPNSQPSSHNSSKLKESTFNQPSAPVSPETRSRRRHRSVRSTHKRAGAVLDDDQEHRTFSEPRQTQFAEKRSRRATQYEQQQQRQH